VKTLITAGKGGTGKSMLIAHLLQRHILPGDFGRVLVVDADPHQSLTRLMGIRPGTTLGTLRHTHNLSLKTGQGLEALSRSEFAHQLAHKAIVSLTGGDLLVMGHNDERGCQCVVNNILGRTLDALANDYDLVIVDNEAGIEQVGRHAWQVDALLLVSTPKALDLDVAKRILDRGQEVHWEVKRGLLAVNMAHPGQDLTAVRALAKRMDDMAILSYSAGLAVNETADDGWLRELDTLWERVRPWLR